MKHIPGILALAALLSAGCASQQLKKEAHWEKSSGNLAEDARAGRFHASMDRMMEVAHYMFDTEGFLFVRIDPDAKTFMTDPWKIDDKGDPHIIELDLIQDNAVVTANWKHFVVQHYKNEDSCKDKPDCQKELTDDWNWRLFQHMP